jgi:hypothetical protein
MENFPTVYRRSAGEPEARGEPWTAKENTVSWGRVRRWRP